MICRIHSVPVSSLPTRSSDRCAGRPVILVVDDEACVRNLLRIVLERTGFLVWLAADGREAVDLYRRHCPEIALVLLDVRMPVLDGPATLAILRRINPTVTCCFMSGNAAEYSENQLLARMISKPFRLEEVAGLFRQLAPVRG
jgi:CheY-like chemotaxis protein